MYEVFLNCPKLKGRIVKTCCRTMAEGENVREGGTELDTAELDKSGTEVWLDGNFEPIFFQSRYVLLLPVIISFVGAIVMFAVGSYQTYKAVYAIVIYQNFGGAVVTLPIIKALDAFLVGIILIIFSFGIYDFFVSKLDPADHAGIRPDWFKFETTGELKTKLIEVVLVILAIKFFEQIVANIDSFDSPMLYLVIPTGAAILAVSLGFFKWATE